MLENLKRIESQYKLKSIIHLLPNRKVSIQQSFTFIFLFRHSLAVTQLKKSIQTLQPLLLSSFQFPQIVSNDVPDILRVQQQLSQQQLQLDQEEKPKIFSLSPKVKDFQEYNLSIDSFNGNSHLISLHQLLITSYYQLSIEYLMQRKVPQASIELQKAKNLALYKLDRSNPLYNLLFPQNVSETQLKSSAKKINIQYSNTASSKSRSPPRTSGRKQQSGVVLNSYSSGKIRSVSLKAEYKMPTGASIVGKNDHSLKIRPKQRSSRPKFPESINITLDDNQRQAQNKALFLPRSTKNSNKSTGRKLFLESADENEKLLKLVGKQQSSVSSGAHSYLNSSGKYFKSSREKSKKKNKQALILPTGIDAYSNQRYKSPSYASTSELPSKYGNSQRIRKVKKFIAIDKKFEQYQKAYDISLSRPLQHTIKANTLLLQDQEQQKPLIQQTKSGQEILKSSKIRAIQGSIEEYDTRTQSRPRSNKNKKTNPSSNDRYLNRVEAGNKMIEAKKKAVKSLNYNKFHSRVQQTAKRITNPYDPQNQILIHNNNQIIMKSPTTTLSQSSTSKKKKARVKTKRLDEFKPIDVQNDLTPKQSLVKSSLQNFKQLMIFGPLTSQLQKQQSNSKAKIKNNLKRITTEISKFQNKLNQYNQHVQTLKNEVLISASSRKSSPTERYIHSSQQSHKNSQNNSLNNGNKRSQSNNIRRNENSRRNSSKFWNQQSSSIYEKSAQNQMDDDIKTIAFQQLSSVSQVGGGVSLRGLRASTQMSGGGLILGPRVDTPISEKQN